jgi:hypothetical protein
MPYIQQDKQVFQFPPWPPLKSRRARAVLDSSSAMSRTFCGLRQQSRFGTDNRFPGRAKMLLSEPKEGRGKRRSG